jgi:hypothetical protein
LSFISDESVHSIQGNMAIILSIKEDRVDGKNGGLRERGWTGKKKALLTFNSFAYKT